MSGESGNFKDLFSSQARDYSQFRPRYPASLFDFLASLAPSRKSAWDVGTGNGQAALELASRFEIVIATDPSESQLLQATPHARIDYRRVAAEASDLPSNSVDLITVAQAFHWFKAETFFAEVRRVARPRAVLAVWCYELAHITPAVDAAVLRFYRGSIGSYWEPERQLVETGYREVRFPFTRIESPPFEMKEEWDFEHLFGYLGTWSATRAAQKATGRDLLAESRSELLAAWGGSPESIHPVTWPLFLHVFRIGQTH